MAAKDIRILSEGDQQIVEFVGEGREVVSVRLSRRADNDDDAIRDATSLLVRMSSAPQAANDHDAKGGSPRESLEAEQRRQATSNENADLDKALKDTFPASDPVAATSGAVGVDHRRPSN